MKSIVSLLLILIFVIVFLATSGLTAESGGPPGSAYMVGLPMITTAGDPAPVEEPPIIEEPAVNSGELPPLPNLLVSAFRRFGLQPPALLLRWASWTALSPVGRAYQELNQALVIVRRPPLPAATPSERAALLAKEIPTARDAAEIVVDEYQISTYGMEHGNPKNAMRAGRLLRQLSIRTLLRRFIPGSRTTQTANQ